MKQKQNQITGQDVPFPYFRISSADAEGRGRALGESAREYVLESIDAYRETFDHYTGLDWPAVRDLALEFEAPIEAYDPEIMAELRGLAMGAGVELGDVLALNARSEIMFGLAVLPPPECTAFFAGPRATADGHVLLGQNWDWRPRAIRSTVLVEVDQGDRPSFTMLPEAGLIGKVGFNECGVGVTLNALVSGLDVGERLVPIHVILRGILNSRSVDEALSAIVRSRRGASAAYTIADASGVGIAVEVGPGGVETVQLLQPVDDVLAHSNHFASGVRFDDVGARKWPDSLPRIETMRSFLTNRSAGLDSDAIQEILRNEDGHPDAICRFANPSDHPVEQSATVASIVMDLTERRALIAAGAPSETTYASFVPAFAASGVAA